MQAATPPVTTRVASSLEPYAGTKHWPHSGEPLRPELATLAQPLVLRWNAGHPGRRNRGYSTGIALVDYLTIGFLFVAALGWIPLLVVMNHCTEILPSEIEPASVAPDAAATPQGRQYSLAPDAAAPDAAAQSSPASDAVAPQATQYSPALHAEALPSAAPDVAVPDAVAQSSAAAPPAPIVRSKSRSTAAFHVPRKLASSSTSVPIDIRGYATSRTLLSIYTTPSPPTFPTYTPPIPSPPSYGSSEKEFDCHMVIGWQKAPILTSLLVSSLYILFCLLYCTLIALCEPGCDILGVIFTVLRGPSLPGPILEVFPYVLLLPVLPFLFITAPGRMIHRASQDRYQYCVHEMLGECMNRKFKKHIELLHLLYTSSHLHKCAENAGKLASAGKETPFKKCGGSSTPSFQRMCSKHDDPFPDKHEMNSQFQENRATLPMNCWCSGEAGAGCTSHRAGMHASIARKGGKPIQRAVPSTSEDLVDSKQSPVVFSFAMQFGLSPTTISGVVWHREERCVYEARADGSVTDFVEVLECRCGRELWCERSHLNLGNDFYWS